MTCSLYPDRFLWVVANTDTNTKAALAPREAPPTPPREAASKERWARRTGRSGFVARRRSVAGSRRFVARWRSVA
ncbi:hypothetical protein KAV67_02190, partial [Candidatus Bipolaricaulota bacterium]|nr:hypothetical protein [Candidatus Bipolaricaulota bacterium]